MIYVFLFIKADRFFVFTIHSNVHMVYFGYFLEKKVIKTKFSYTGISIPAYFLE